MQQTVYKVIGVVLVLYSLIFGLLTSIPDLPIIEESIRNLFYHVSMWFAMVAMMAGSFAYSIAFLRKENMYTDRRTAVLTEMGIIFAFLGLYGMIWARFTWGAWWTNDPKLNGSAITILIYLAYFILRNGIEDERKKSKNQRRLQHFRLCDDDCFHWCFTTHDRQFTSW